MPGLVIDPMGIPLWSKDTPMELPERGKSSNSPPTPPKPTRRHPCPHAGGDDSGGRSTRSPRQAQSPFNLHLPPPSIALLYLARASDSNSCGLGAAGWGEGSAHARTETQLKKVEYGLTKNKRQVSCLPLG